MAENPGTLAVVGDKPKSQLSRAMPQAFKVTFNSVGKDVPTFAEASAIADEIVKNGGEWDEVSFEPFSYPNIPVVSIFSFGNIIALNILLLS